MAPGSRTPHRAAFAGLVVLLAVTHGAAGGRPRPPASYPAAVRVVVLEGTPFHRGLVHGRTLKREIHEVIAAWKASVATTHRIDAATFVARFLGQTSFLPAIRRWTPDLLEEVRGMAEGSGVDFETMLAFQLPDEQWVFGPTLTSDRCSGLGLGRQGSLPALTAQNMDVPAFYNGHQTVLHVKERDGLESFVLTSAGLIAMNGMNSRGVSVCTNTLAQLAPSRDGLPVAFVVRGLLGQRSQADAVAFARSVKHASGQNYIIGGPGQPVDLECSATMAVEVAPSSDDPLLVCHTNHVLASRDFSADYRRWTERTGQKAQDAGFAGTRARLQALRTRLDGRSGVRDIARVMAALRSRDSEANPICRHIGRDQGGFTFASTIMVLSTQPYLLVAAGPPDGSEYLRLSFEPGR